MAQVNHLLSSSIIQFSISNVSQLTTGSSPQTTWHGIPWKIDVIVYGTGAEKTLGVHLFCAHEDNTHWTAAAWAIVKLLSYSTRVQPIDFNIPPYVYDRSGRSFGTYEMVYWNNLFDRSKKFVQNDTIKFEVLITAENTLDSNRSASIFRGIDKSCCQGTYEIIVKNVSKLVAVRSRGFVMCGKPYDLDAFKNDTHLGVRLKLKQRVSLPSNIAMSIELTSTKRAALKVKHFGKPEDVNIVTWKKLINPINGFVTDDTITLKITINANDLVGRD